MSIYDLTVPESTVYVLVILRLITFILYVIRVSKDIEMERGTYRELTEEDKQIYVKVFIQMILTNAL